jgi:hypothetical protein
MRYPIVIPKTGLALRCRRMSESRRPHDFPPAAVVSEVVAQTDLAIRGERRRPEEFNGHPCA